MYSAPRLPENISVSLVYQAVPELLDSVVDGNQNHDNTTGFFSVIDTAGLSVRVNSLQEMKAGARVPVDVASAKVVSGTDVLRIVTTTGETIDLAVSRYRAEFGLSPFAAEDITNLNEIRFFAVSKDMNNILRFAVVKK